MQMLVRDFLTMGDGCAPIKDKFPFKISLINSNQYIFELADSSVMPNLNKNVSIDWIMSVEMFLDAYTTSQLLSNWWEENTEIEYGRLFS
jgi:hypothetical protein